MLMNAVEVPECRECERYAIHNVWGFCFSTLANSSLTKFTVPEAHFHAKSISASPAVIAHKTVKLLKVLHLQTLCDPTIDSSIFRS